MPTSGHQLPDDEEKDEVAYCTDEQDSDEEDYEDYYDKADYVMDTDDEMVNSDEEVAGTEEVDGEMTITISPTGLTAAQRRFLNENVSEAERNESHTQFSRLVEASELGAFSAIGAMLDAHTFFEELYSKVTARVSNAATSIAPTVPPTEQGEQGYRWQGNEEGEEQMTSSERPTSDAGATPEQSENHPQP